MRKATAAFAQWIELQIDGLSRGTALPSDTELAAVHGLSRKTVESVMKCLAAAKKVTRIPGSGTFAGYEQPKSPPKTLPKRKTTGESLTSALLGSIAQGEFKSGEALPSVTFMSRRFKVAQAAVTTAYRELEARGLLARVGRTYWIGTFGRLVHSQSRKEVLFVVNTNDQLVSAFETDQYAEAFRHAELILADAGYFLKTVNAENFATVCRSTLAGKKMPYGIILFKQNNLTLPELLEPLALLRNRKQRAAIPLVIDWDWTVFESFPPKSFLISRPNLTTTLARTLSSFLVERGLSHARLILGWNERFGRTDYTRDFGDAIKVFTEVRHLVPTCTFTVALVDVPASMIDTPLSQICEKTLFEKFASKYTPTTLADLKHHFLLYESLNNALNDSLKESALVFQQDRHAAFALDFLSSRRVKIPRDIALVGLDCDPRYFHLGLTRCQFDYETMGYLIAHAIIGDITVPRTSKGFIRNRARMIERLTTR